MYRHSTQVKNKRIEMVNCSKQPNFSNVQDKPNVQVLLILNKLMSSQETVPDTINRNSDLFKVSQHTVNAKETKLVTHLLLTRNKSISGQQTRQETNNQETNIWNNDLLKVNSQCIGVMQTKRHRWCMLMTLGRSLCNDQ